jgi:hypothetical protein
MREMWRLIIAEVIWVVSRGREPRQMEKQAELKLECPAPGYWVVLVN